ncbi:hypothetical protein [Streptomyces sporangiiformans]|uniref:Uncharacterized protein n=1 Tax=Streptomyces sporangiiformans TaxID=2315329 RepID=A0A505CXB1_9ACTN|nr:hypothetical protein [Streptomyces sporangiiformans]TPQ16204.1 hypothetical protein FGD71_042845 [Streptomyces sporangiiformans]
MAKNKNRKQSARQNPASQPDQAQEQSRSASPEAQQAIQALTQDGPTDTARKRQKRFGHN